MNSSNLHVMPAPPSLMKSLMAGFDAISNHVGLIVFSVALDLLLWLGPRLRLVELIKPVLLQPMTLPALADEGLADVIRSTFERFNLISVLRIFPVGVPSLMASRGPAQAPTGKPMIWEVLTLESAFGMWLLLTIVGLSAGALYYSVVAQAALVDKVSWRQAISRWPWALLQVLLLTITWLVLLLLLVVPFSCFFSVLVYSGLGIEPIALIVAVLFGGLLVWLLIPLAFSPHGIFVNGQAMWASLVKSIHLTRMTLPSTSLLFLTILIISEGLDLLWSMPAENSWFTLVGIAGHAFITTSLLAASFVYYRDVNHWVQRMLQQTKMTVV